MLHISNQERKVYEYIRDHNGCTTHDITRDTFIQKPCARIVGLQSKGVAIEVVGEVKYEGTRPFKKYALQTQLTKKVSRVEIVDGVAYEKWETVPV